MDLGTTTMMMKIFRGNIKVKREKTLTNFKTHQVHVHVFDLLTNDVLNYINFLKYYSIALVY